MIDRTQLTEALRKVSEIREELRKLGLLTLLDALDELEEAGWSLLDFPSDEQVEAAAPFITGDDPRMVLEAVRDTMIGDG